MNSADLALVRATTLFSLEVCRVAKIATQLEREKGADSFTVWGFATYGKVQVQMGRRWFKKAQAAGVLIQVLQGQGQGKRAIWSLTDLGDRLGKKLMELEQIHKGAA